MDYKRLETYVWWTCNQKCTYCMEYPNMEKVWNKRVTKYDVLKKLIKYKKLWYNHVTYLWGEPFIQWVFLDALKIGKKLWYTILVTTNATTLHIDAQASKFLPYIDELLLSVEAIWIEEQQKISRTKNYVHWDWVFENIKKYWRWTFMKANIVITQDNKNNLVNLVEFLYTKGVSNIAITYPDIDLEYYWREHILSKVAPRYSECINEILHIIHFCDLKGIHLKLPDFPFCVFPKESIRQYIKLTDDFDYATRIKINHNEWIDDRWDLSDSALLPRKRNHCEKCLECTFKNTCWWPSEFYKELYWLSEITSIRNI